MPAVHRTVLEQTGDFFRAYVGTSLRALHPGEGTGTTLDYESLAGDPIFGRDFEQTFEESGGERFGTDLTARGFLHPGQPIDGPEGQFQRDSPVDAVGSFVGRLAEEVLALLPLGPVRVAVYYLGTAQFAPCHSEDLEVAFG